MTQFENRYAAGLKLIPYLEKYRNANVMVMGIPRGGVVVGYAVASHFRWPLHIILTKKIGHPQNREYAIGAVSLDGIVLDPAHREIPVSYIESETQLIRNMLQERLLALTGNLELPDPANKTVIVVDDGIATGHTMNAAVKLLRLWKAGRVVVAAPVAALSAHWKLKQKSDDLIVLDTPEHFTGVGQFYTDFSEVTDEEASRYLRASRVMG